MDKRFSSILLVALLAACGSNPTQPDATAGKRIEGISLSPGIAQIAKKEGKVELVEDERVKCEKYMPLGSHRVRYRCVTLAEEVASKEANNHEMRKIQTPPPSVGARTIGQ